jgi:hypothetical protein
MVSRFAAGVVAGLFALAATPAVAQVKVERKPVQAEAKKKLEAELERLKAVEAELQAQLELLRTELDRENKIERIEKSKTERKLADLKKEAQAEFDRAMKLGDDGLKRAQIEFEKALKHQEKPGKLAEEVEKLQRLRDEPSKLQDELTRQAQKEIDRVIELQLEEKPRVLVLGAGAGKTGVNYEQMSAQELKQLIVKLQLMLDEKTRSEKVKPGIEKVKPGIEKVKPGIEKVKPGTVSQDEILKRLDKLSHEVEELKRSIKK